MTASTLPQKIWLAGLGALARAEREGDAWLAELMAEGEIYEAEKTSELMRALDTLSSSAATGRSKIRQQLDNIEQAFETKVSYTLSKVGMVSRHELVELQARLAALEAALAQEHSEN